MLQPAPAHGVRVERVSARVRSNGASYVRSCKPPCGMQPVESFDHRHRSANGCGGAVELTSGRYGSAARIRTRVST